MIRRMLSPFTLYELVCDHFRGKDAFSQHGFYHKKSLGGWPSRNP